MPKIQTPARFDASEAAAIGLATIAKLKYFGTVDSHGIVILTGRTIEPFSDALPDRAKALCHWLIDLEYLQVVPNRYKNRLTLKLHDLFTSADDAIDSFRCRFGRSLAAHSKARRDRCERLEAMPTIAYQQKLQKIGA